ncbi:6678_t:CDS:2 [Gigaspora margarita]|uniref:6678_t:CDS:1 n=1 Tax=Gigaspora margarita TaxID=4874 RepID=A0ABN7UC60_GIGMA|nr:6678_t:CDS:2 [Gigaspora margarita]
MRLDIEIKKLFQKKEQEIVGILKKFKNRVLKKDKAVTKYLGIQDKNAHRLCKCKLKARELQEEIVRINGTTHLLERESPTDIVMSEKEEVSPVIADVTNKVKVLQDRIQSMLIQEKNKKSHPMEVDCLTYDKVREDIFVSKWAPHNRVNSQAQIKLKDLLKGIWNSKIQSSEMITNSNYTIISALINLDHLTFNNNMAKTRAKKYIQESIYYLVNEDITEEEWEQVVLTASNKSAHGASGISYTLIKMAGPFLQQKFKEFANMCFTHGQVPKNGNWQPFILYRKWIASV